MENPKEEDLVIDMTGATVLPEDMVVGIQDARDRRTKRKVKTKEDFRKWLEEEKQAQGITD